MIRIILVRHGRTAWNSADDRARRFRGTVDLALADEGVLQARSTAQRLADLPLTAVYSSPLQRASHTAEIIAEPHNLVPQVLAGLGSMNYGQWAGLTHDEVAQTWPDLLEQWRRDPFHARIPSGENTADLHDRAIAALHEILNLHADGETIAVITHQVVTRVLICTLVQVPDHAWLRFSQDLCNLSCFDYDPSSGVFSLAVLNDTCHLKQTLPRAGKKGTRLILVRHGQTAWNAGAGDERFRGRMDLPLDDTGMAQARSVANRLRNESVDAIYTSPLLRARQTIGPLAREQALLVQPHDGLYDIDYGQFQGMTHVQAAAKAPDLCASWRGTPSRIVFPKGEGLADIQHRLQGLLDEMIARHPDQTVMLVGHQIVNKTLASMLLNIDLDGLWQVGQDTAAINVFQHADGLWHTLRLNDTCHLI